ncbi:MAG: putative porin [Prevotellaceae bacterium]|nr:putative porin [Prevotellaceae bacterium]
MFALGISLLLIPSSVEARIFPVFIHDTVDMQQDVRSDGSDSVQIDTVDIQSNNVAVNEADSVRHSVSNDTVNAAAGVSNDTVIHQNIADSADLTPFDSDEPEADSLVIKRGNKKEEKEKPDTLATYFFEDTLRYNKIIVWKINRYLNSPTIVSPDTLQSENMTELPFYKADAGVTYLGVTGSASLLHDFFKREQSDIFPFMDPYGLYAHTPDNVKFYNAKGPFSNLSYYTSGNKRIAEDNVKVLFTRNVTPSLNFGLSYQKMGALGIYQNQRAKAKTFNIFGSYVGKQYVAHAGYIFNGVNNKENGGIVNDFFIEDTTINSEAIDVKLKSALNVVESNIYFLTHSYGVPLNLFNRDSLATGEGTIVYFGHTFEYARYSRVYSDGVADTAYMDLYDSQGKYQNYYKNNYLFPFQSYDSTFASKLDNRLFIRLQPYSSAAIISKIDGGLGYRFDNYYGFTPDAYLYGARDRNFSTGYVFGNAQGVFSKYFSWQAFLKYHFSGYKVNDLYFDATARLSLYPLEGGIHLNGRFLLDNREQPYFIQNYYSNHFKWNNDFNKTTETRIEASVNVPDLNLEVGFKNSLVSNHVYFDDEALPRQTSDILNITSLYVNSKLKWWILRLDSRIIFQNSSNGNVLPLPTITGNVTFYEESEWVKNVLNSRIGFDVYYNTNFYNYAYNPAVGMFHTQSEKKIGNYPWIDIFASFKWKRANIYVKYTNAGIGIIGGQNYFSALHYPRNNRMLRMGVNWYFHN